MIFKIEDKGFGCKGNNAAHVNFIMPSGKICKNLVRPIEKPSGHLIIKFDEEKSLTNDFSYGIYYFTVSVSCSKEDIVAKNKIKNSKKEELKKNLSLNPHPNHITDTLFCQEEFFDPCDIVQVKYEMLRRVTAEKQSISQASSNFGFTRPSFYKAQQDFENCGLAGLIPKKRGPIRRHKLNQEIVKYLEDFLENLGQIPSKNLVDIVEKNFGIRVHKRSIERALEGSKKKR